MAKRKAVVRSRTKQRLRLFPPVPNGFDAEKATNKDLRRYGLPLRPDPRREPGLTALWDQHVRRYRHFEHLQAAITSADPAIELPTSAFALFPREACGYELNSFNAPLPFFRARGRSRTCITAPPRPAWSSSERSSASASSMFTSR